MSEDKKNTYKVGYKNPPKEHQFPKGQSGNPKGRKKKRKNLLGLYANILEEEILVTEGGRQKMMTVQEAIVRRNFSDALKGKEVAIKRVFQYAPKNEGEEKRYTFMEWAETWNWDGMSDEELDLFQKLFKRYESEVGKK